MKFDALCEFVEDELVDIKRRLVLARSLVPRAVQDVIKKEREW